METEVRVKVKSDVILHKYVVAAGLLCFVISTSVLCVSCVSGGWMFGAAFCQVYGMLSQVLVAGSAWMVALAAVERGYKFLLPTEHVSTFSEINIRILVYGIYLLLLIMYTAPLYGWGEYSHFRGAVHLHVTIVPGNDTGCLDDMNPALVFQNASNVIIHVLAAGYQCQVRFLPMTSAARSLVLRFPNRNLLRMFRGDLASGVFKKSVYDAFLDSFKLCNVTRSNIEFTFQMPMEKYDVYSDVHLPFQELGVCSLDYSPVNTNISSWIPFSVLTTTLVPFGIAFVVGIIVYRAYRAAERKPRCFPLSFILGAILGLLSTVPYYVVNIYNHKEILVGYSVNVTSTVLFYSGALWYTVLYTCFECNRNCKNRARRKRKESVASLDTYTTERRPTYSGLERNSSL